MPWEGSSTWRFLETLGMTSHWATHTFLETSEGRCQIYSQKQGKQASAADFRAFPLKVNQAPSKVSCMTQKMLDTDTLFTEFIYIPTFLPNRHLKHLRSFSPLPLYHCKIQQLFYLVKRPPNWQYGLAVDLAVVLCNNCPRIVDGEHDGYHMNSIGLCWSPLTFTLLITSPQLME